METATQDTPPDGAVFQIELKEFNLKIVLLYRLLVKTKEIFRGITILFGYKL